jgi:hypothetical protein
VPAGATGGGASAPGLADLPTEDAAVDPEALSLGAAGDTSPGTGESHPAATWTPTPRARCHQERKDTKQKSNERGGLVTDKPSSITANTA